MLSDKDAIALAIELNEPETMVEELRRLCERKASQAGEHSRERGFMLMSDNERQRWRNAAEALASVAGEIERANAPQSRANDGESEQDKPSAA